jgi:hypothetical protein
MPVITQSFGKVTILSERVFFESLSLSIGYNGLGMSSSVPQGAIAHSFCYTTFT